MPISYYKCNVAGFYKFGNYHESFPIKRFENDIKYCKSGKIPQIILCIPFYIVDHLKNQQSYSYICKVCYSYNILFNFRKQCFFENNYFGNNGVKGNKLSIFLPRLALSCYLRVMSTCARIWFV